MGKEVGYCDREAAEAKGREGGFVNWIKAKELANERRKRDRGEALVYQLKWKEQREGELAKQRKLREKREEAQSKMREQFFLR